MRLKVLLPTEILVDEPVVKIVAEAPNGAFALLPRHVDLAAALVPGLLAFTTADGREHVMAVYEGVLVKCGSDVLVSTMNAVRGVETNELGRAVTARFQQLDDEQRVGRAALARLEAGALRRFLELEEHGRGR